MFLPMCSLGIIIIHQVGGIFGLGKSAVNSKAGIFRTKLQKDRSLQRKFSYLKSKIET